MKSFNVFIMISISITFFSCKKSEIATPVNGNILIDIDGNNYKIAKIGNKTWMLENLHVTKFNDGTKIPLITIDSIWDTNQINRTTKEMMCYYNNDENNENKYGALYNWYVVNTNKVCPTGWHVPTITEYSDAISKDSINFANVLSGERSTSYYKFRNIDSRGCWWSSTENNPDEKDPYYQMAEYSYITNNYKHGTYHENEYTGYSLRCVKDSL